MTRGTTPKLSFTTPFGKDMVEVVFITFSQNGDVVLEKDTDSVEIEDERVTVSLTQAETLNFAHEEVINIQVAIRTTDGNAFRSNIINTVAKRILKDEQI